MSPNENSWIRVSRGALAGMEGEVLRKLDNHRLLIAVATPNNHGEFAIVPGAYLVIEAACLKPID